MMRLSSSCAGCFAGLSCDSRVEIISLLQKKNKMTVSEIVKHFQLSQPTITHHLKYLKESKVLASEKKGRQVYYFIHPKCKKDICNLFL